MHMRTLIGIISLLLLLLSFPSALESYGLRRLQEKGGYLTQEEHWFHQTLDHFSPTEHLHGKYNMSEYESAWFVIGSSYAGALSAWFHLKFPHLTCGSLASSASILASYNFIEYDQQVGESAGAECKAVLQEITALVDRKLEEEGQQVKNLFGAAKISNNVDFLYLLADAAAAAFQYGFPDDLCSPLVDAKTNGKDLLVVWNSAQQRCNK
ncbi:hypothetical protein C4D60_Mb04t24660 [Musa balbisiana]|uniref:Serine protease EDA2 n=1 Tax=Musa balbisiana TaxID=52838 RepID=A0A4S8KEE3_MUSBA|nr:hypothetical protein C4D60_Mb04t24660 [Musa balbisiana]